MLSINEARVLGNLTHDVELRKMPSGRAVTSFSVATNRLVKDGDKYREDAEYHRVVAFGRLAEQVSQYLGKGDQVYVEGRLQTRDWETSGGEKQSSTEIVADVIQFGAKAGKKPARGSDCREGEAVRSVEEILDTKDVPF